MSGASQSLNFSRSPPYLLGLLIVAMAAFWPSYFALGLSGSHNYVHVHAATCLLWMAMLIAQPIFITRRRLDLHRLVGKSSYVIAPVLIVSMVLLAHYRINLIAPADYALQTYILFLQLSLAVVFAVFYALAIAYRHTTAVHARFMVCTALTLIDPILARVVPLVAPDMIPFTQWISFVLTDSVVIVLIWMERGSLTGRKVFPIALGILLTSQLPALLGFDRTEGWQQFARWFKDLQLT
jgi:hypothetical protein